MDTDPERLFDDDGELINDPTPVYPVLFLELEPGDHGYKEGYRWAVEQLDEDINYFRDRDRATDFIIREGLDVIDIDPMIRMREAGETY